MSKTLVFSVIACVTLPMLALGITTTYYGFADEDADCQRGERGGLNLSDWVKGQGLTTIIMVGWIWLMSLILIVTDNDTVMVPFVFVIVLDILFAFMWWIWGIVILATNENNRCVAEGKGMAIMCIINLVIGLFGTSSYSSLLKMND